MNYRYLPLLLAVIYSTQQGLAQNLNPAPRLVVNITIDQLRTDYIEHFSPLYANGGFKRLLSEGCVYEQASYPFSDVDAPSAIATIATGTTPYYNNIVARRWLDRNTLRPVDCADDSKTVASPQRMTTSTVSDELKVSTSGAAIVYGIAADRDAAILSAGHAADGAFWIDQRTGDWSSSPYFSQTIRRWLSNYRSANTKPGNDRSLQNDAVATFGLNLIKEKAIGMDEITDYLALTLSAAGNDDGSRNSDMEMVYRKLDRTLSDIISGVEQQVGQGKVLFVVTSTGYIDNPKVDYTKFRIPTGTFYINRTANLLNMYLGAIYGQGRYVATCYRNQIYLDRKLIENKRLSLEDILSRSRDFLVQIAGVRGAERSPYSPSVSGDLVVEVAPGWQLVNEESGENFYSRASFIPFPIIFLGPGIEKEHVLTPVTTDRIAPTIAKSIQIRAPNACKSAPLQ